MAECPKSVLKGGDWRKGRWHIVFFFIAHPCQRCVCKAGFLKVPRFKERGFGIENFGRGQGITSSQEPEEGFEDVLL